MRLLLRARRVVVMLVASAPIALSACEGTRADAGRDAMLRVDGAQFFREAMPAAEDGPAVLSATVVSRARAGVVERACAGDLERPATAIAIGLSSDVGYWVVPAGIPLASAPSAPTFDAVLGLAASARPGRYDVVLRGVDAAGRFGPATTRPLEVVPTLRPAGRFVIALSWQNEADLDLHVVLPSGVEIFKRNRTEYQRPPPSAGPVDPSAPTDGGFLDRDSNAMCVADGVRAENVVWTEPPPPGRYVVRVDTFSLCGAPSAPWRVEATLDGTRIGAAQGTSTAVDTRFEHNRGGGVLALELDVP
ncbi:MAG: hypothetical protein KF850_41105 [Labilithrix sp.]|nr:hypothetical protein [Labilithrix sp.]MBX3218477.1 hypothetical protein [Labilithrix sp.]